MGRVVQSPVKLIQEKVEFFFLGFSFASVLSFKNRHIHKTEQHKTFVEKRIIRLTFNPQSGYKSILHCIQQVNLP